MTVLSYNPLPNILFVLILDQDNIFYIMIKIEKYMEKQKLQTLKPLKTLWKPKFLRPTLTKCVNCHSFLSSKVSLYKLG